MTDVLVRKANCRGYTTVLVSLKNMGSKFTQNLYQSVYQPASGGEDYNCPGAAFEGGLHSSDCRDLRGIRGERSETPQLLKQLLVENGRLRLPADLRQSDRDRERGRQRVSTLSEVTKSDAIEHKSHSHRNTHRVHHCNCLHRKQSLGGFSR